VGGGARPPGARPAGPAGKLLAELAEEPLNVDQLASRLALSTPQVLMLLTELEIIGVVRRMPGMRFSVAA